MHSQTLEKGRDLKVCLYREFFLLCPLSGGTCVCDLDEVICSGGRGEIIQILFHLSVVTGGDQYTD